MKPLWKIFFYSKHRTDNLGRQQVPIIQMIHQKFFLVGLDVLRMDIDVLRWMLMSHVKGCNTTLWGNRSSPTVTESTEQWVTWSCRSVAEKWLGEGPTDDFSDTRNINCFGTPSYSRIFQGTGKKII